MTGAAEPLDGEADGADRHLGGYVGYALRRALAIVQADLSQVLAEHRLRAASFSALTIIVAEPGLTQTQLADALQIERSNLVAILDELAGRGLIVRAAVAHDRRRHALAPTAAGRALAAAAREAVAAHERRLFAGLTDAERAELRRLLVKFRRSASG